MEKLACKQDATLSLTFVNDDEIKNLNLKYRGKDTATDILSFQSAFNIQNVLGDLIISVDTAKLNAKNNKHNLFLEYIYLITHGVLHLLGYSHSKKMFDIQDAIYTEVYDEYRNIK